MHLRNVITLESIRPSIRINSRGIRTPLQKGRKLGQGKGSGVGMGSTCVCVCVRWRGGGSVFRREGRVKVWGWITQIFWEREVLARGQRLAKFGPSPVHVNKVLLGHSHSQSLRHSLWLCLHHIGSIESL